MPSTPDEWDAQLAQLAFLGGWDDKRTWHRVVEDGGPANEWRTVCGLSYGLSAVHGTKDAVPPGLTCPACLSILGLA